MTDEAIIGVGVCGTTCPDGYYPDSDTKMCTSNISEFDS